MPSYNNQGLCEIAAEVIIHAVVQRFTVCEFFQRKESNYCYYSCCSICGSRDSVYRRCYEIVQSESNRKVSADCNKRTGDYR